MLPAFGDEYKRKINLGGISSAATSTDILSRALAERAKREEDRRRIESAVKIQAWYRGTKDVQRVREQLRFQFERDITSMTGLRCLVLMGRDEEALSLWASTVLSLGQGQIYSPALGEHRESWLVLVRKVALQLLQSIADSPESKNSSTYLALLDTLLSTEIASAIAGDIGLQACRAITRYLVQSCYFQSVGRAIRNIPITKKSSPNLVHLADLATRPFRIFSPSDDEFKSSTFGLVVSVLTVPLLPNKLPIAALPHFTARLPLRHLHVLHPLVSEIISSTSVEDKVHLTANLYMFASPNYKAFKTSFLATYLYLSVSLLNSFSLSSIRPKKSTVATSKGQKNPPPTWLKPGYDSDASDSHPTRVTVVDSFTSQTVHQPLLDLDDRTLKRLTNIGSPSHLASLVAVAERSLFPNLIAYMFALMNSAPSMRENILNTALAQNRGAFVTQLYKGMVRGSPLGKAADGAGLLDPGNAHHWLPLLFLVDLYSQTLLTMGDDEFFGTQRGNQGSRNPLSVDELISFGRQLLNIAFNLYMREDLSRTETRISQEVNCTWEVVREKVTKCLVAIHARDSRRPFAPKDHWLAVSQIDINSFIEAALLDEQQLSRSDTPHPRTLSRMQVASISPRLGILNNIPFAIPFEIRASIFRHFVANDKQSKGNLSRHPVFGRRPRIPIRREMVAQDGFDKLGDIDLKAPFEIVFIDQFDQEEAGIDGGGVFKEFFTSLCKEVFDTDRGLWLANTKNELYPNPHAYATEAHSLNWYRFLGRILGMAMYEDILIDVGFAGFFLAKWLGKQSYLDDLASLDPDLYNGLIFLKHYTGQVEDLSLNFTVAIDEFGVTNSIDLIPDGSNTPVTKENRLMYITLVSHYRLNKQIKLQSGAFFEGLSEMIDSQWLRMFNQQELQVLIGGVNAPIDLNDLRHYTNYGGLYDDNHETIKAFWNVVNSFDQEQRRSLLRFVTSCSRPPLLGFKELAPNFSIRDAGSDQYRLPTSSTCVNLLKLPRYTTERQLRQKLLQAINANAGFDLS